MITVIGVDGSPLSGRAAEAVAGATLLVGGRRHLAAAGRAADEPGHLTGPGATATIPRVMTLGPLRPALDALAAHAGDAVVLASGDPGFFGIVRALRERGLDCIVLPAVSSVALAFARAGLPWDDAMVVSAHGRDLRPAVNVCRAYPKVAVLTGPGQGPAEIGAALAGWPRRLLVAEDLGRPGERITECAPADAAVRSWTDPNVVLALAPCTSDTPTTPAPAPALAPPAPPATPVPAPADSTHSPSRPHMSLASHAHPAGPTGAWSLWTGPGPGPGWALAEEAFEHRDSMVTKPEVRALALARLGPGPGQLVWDVGAGSGSVAVECARFGAAVIAVERDPAQCARVTANARRHGAEVRVVGGAAPQALEDLPDPDAVFAGGGGLAVVGAVAARRPARIVVALAAVQRAGQAVDVLRDAGYTVEGTLLQASRLTPLPDGAHRLAAANPVFLLWATLPQPARHGGPA